MNLTTKMEISLPESLKITESVKLDKIRHAGNATDRATPAPPLPFKSPCRFGMLKFTDKYV